MLINVSEGEECRIAIVEDAKLEELYMERTSSTSHVGNIYKGRVTNVEPSIQAAFVDFGLGRNGFLHISDLMPTYFGRKGEDIQESVGRKMARRDRPPIQRCLRRGDDIIVQIIKEGIGTKGPTLSTYVSIPGRILVMMPGMSKFGVSRKIEDEDERKRLRTILDSLKPLKDVGFIIRTAGIGKTKTEIQRDLQYLTRLWQTIQKKLKQPAPQELYTEGDLVTRTVRDVFSTDINRIVVDNKEVARRIKEFFKIAMPRTKNKVELYDEPVPLFHKAGIEREIEQMYSRHVPLPSGGSLVIDSTEAIVAIDVNSGKFRDHADAETTAFKTDMEAADEIPRQLRLRDLGGVIICDFIDLRYERHRRDLERKLHDNLKKDRAKTKVLRMSQFGIIEMTRQRMRPSLKRSIYFDCPHCKGSGLVKTPESMSLDVMRRLAIAVHSQRVARVEMGVCPEVAFYLSNRKRAQIADLEAETGKRVIMRADQTLGLDELKLDLFDTRDGLVFLDELGMSAVQQLDPRGRRHQQPTHQRGHDQRQRGAPPQQQPHRGQPPQLPAPQPVAARQEMEEIEDDVDEREESREAETGVEAAPSEASREPKAEESKPARGRSRSRRGKAKQAEPVEPDEPFESNVEDVEEPSEPIGDAPRAMDDERRDRFRDRDRDDQGGRRGRRRRGRRGRGGRGRNGEPAQQQQQPPRAQPDEPDEVVVETSDEASDSTQQAPVESGGAPAAEGEPGQRRRRRRRGGRRHRRRKENAPANGESAHETGGEAASAAASSSAPEIEPVAAPARHTTAHRTPPPRTPPPPIVRTGSTDRHLMKDEPADHEPHAPPVPVDPIPAPTRRASPRTYRDLDAIPEDFD
jgi:ribonuclease E